MSAKTYSELTVELLASMYAHNAELRAHIGRTDVSQSDILTADKVGKDFKKLFKYVNEPFSTSDTDDSNK